MSTDRAGNGMAMSTEGSVHGNNYRVKKADARSCIVCHRRKVRCDRKLPCATCSRTGVLCCYPSGDKPVQRQPKTTISAIAERLVQLERTLAVVSGDTLSAAGEHDRLPNRDATPASESEGADAGNGEGDGADTAPSAGDVLITDGRSGRYFNEVILSRVLEEEQEIRTVLENSPSDRNSSGKALVHERLLSSGPLLGLAEQDLLPRKDQAIQIWDVYVHKIDLLCKVLHVPTGQVTFFTAIHNPDAATHEVRALLFAICHAAVTTLSSQESFAILQENKAQSLDRFRVGLEHSLACANWLEHPTLIIIQALGIYLKMLRAHGSGRSAWLLTALAIRAAQSIGMHRDGSRFTGLSPFEAEMRRRVWWHIQALDSRAAEDHGITVASADGAAANVRLPLNVDDAALQPDMKELPAEAAGRWTEMTLPLVTMEVSRALMRLARMLPPSTVSGTAGTPGPFGVLPEDLARLEARRNNVIAKLRERCDLLLRPCHDVVPIQRTTRAVGTALMRKSAFIARQQWISIVAPHERYTRKELLDAVETLELNTISRIDSILERFRWSAELYKQYHVLTYLLQYLTIRPFGDGGPDDVALADRAWRLLEGVIESEEVTLGKAAELKGSSVAGEKWQIIRMLRRKAALARETAQRERENSETGDARTAPVTEQQGATAAGGQPQHDIGLTGNFDPFLQNPEAWVSYDWNDFPLDLGTPNLETNLQGTWATTAQRPKTPDDCPMQSL